MFSAPWSIGPVALVIWALDVLWLLLIVDVAASWLVGFGMVRSRSANHWLRQLRRVTEPVTAPFRALAPPSRLGGIDISPLLACFAIYLVQRALVSLAAG